MAGWLFASMPVPTFIEGLSIVADPQSLPQPTLQYGRGHTMTTNAGIHGQTMNTIWFIPALFLLAITNCLIWIWFYITRVRIKTQNKLRAKPSKKLIPAPSSV